MKMNVNIRKIFWDYKSEFIFGILLLAGVLLSYFFAGNIPIHFYKNSLSPILNGTIATVCLLGAGLLWRHHEGIRVRKMWACVLAVWACLATLLLLHVMAYDVPVDTEDTISLRGWEMAIGNFYAWLLLLYPTEVLRPGLLTVKRSVAVLLPVAVVAVVDELFSVDLRLLLAMYPVVLAGLLAMHMRAYRIWCEENYSSMENIDVQWIWRYIIMYLIIGGTYCVMSWSYNAAHAFTEQWLLLFMLSYSTEQILFRPDPWAEVKSRRPQPPEPEEAAADDPSEMPNAAYRETLEAWMQSERPYLNPEFRLMDMRQVLPLNRTYLSQLINTEYGCNFYQFVTNYRIDEAKRLMRENPDMKIQDISEQCGFSSPTVFARVFARETGMLPREWMQKSDNS